MANTPITRQNLLTALHQSQGWDVIVIGGGATGLGTALEAVTRECQIPHRPADGACNSTPRTGRIRTIDRALSLRLTCSREKN
ncbi:MAG: hypothetical protein HC781_19205 [Leptolyngbyaceae cyanobacterium CSU_1_4]|nr:hypothetical protein [Leptolyngbyaceae cyanobacterium CSU_1_4]